MSLNDDVCTIITGLSGDEACFMTILYNAHQATKTAGLRKLEIKDVPEAFCLLKDVR